jgi:hypothetical protein
MGGKSNGNIVLIIAMNRDKRGRILCLFCFIFGVGRILFPGSIWFHIIYEQGRFGGGLIPLT